MTKHDYFSYNDGKGIVPDGVFRISPSQISRFFDDTTNWWREMLLGEAGFTGSTATHLGTVTHAAAEMQVNEGAILHDQILDYIDSIDDPEVDKSLIKYQYPLMSEVLVNDYVKHFPPTKTELFLAEQVIDGIWCGGSIDSIYGSTIVDYKTTSAKSPPTKIARSYWFQQCVYVWLARKAGYDIRSFRLVFVTRSETGRVSEKTGKSLKDYPSAVSYVDHYVTDMDMEIIENSIKLIAESVKTWQDSPELRYILAQDYRLKLKNKARTFKK